MSDELPLIDHAADRKPGSSMSSSRPSTLAGRPPSTRTMRLVASIRRCVTLRRKSSSNSGFEENENRPNSSVCSAFNQSMRKLSVLTSATSMEDSSSKGSGERCRRVSLSDVSSSDPVMGQYDRSITSAATSGQLRRGGNMLRRFSMGDVPVRAPKPQTQPKRPISNSKQCFPAMSLSERAMDNNDDSITSVTSGQLQRSGGRILRRFSMDAPGQPPKSQPKSTIFRWRSPTSDASNGGSPIKGHDGRIITSVSTDTNGQSTLIGGRILRRFSMGDMPARSPKPKRPISRSKQCRPASDASFGDIPVIDHDSSTASVATGQLTRIGGRILRRFSMGDSPAPDDGSIITVATDTSGQSNISGRRILRRFSMGDAPSRPYPQQAKNRPISRSKQSALFVREQQQAEMLSRAKLSEQFLLEEVDAAAKEMAHSRWKNGECSRIVIVEDDNDDFIAHHYNLEKHHGDDQPWNGWDHS